MSSVDVWKKVREKNEKKDSMTPEKKPLLTVCIITNEPEKIINNFPEWVQVVIGVNGKGEQNSHKLEGTPMRKIVLIEYVKFRFDEIRNITGSFADGLFTMQLDTDEDFRHWDELKALLESNPEAKAFTCSVLSITSDYECINTRSNRIFKTGLKYYGAAHETIDHDRLTRGWDCIPTALRINHYGYFLDLEGMIKKLKRNLRLMNSFPECYKYEYYRKKLIDTTNKLKELE